MNNLSRAVARVVIAGALEFGDFTLKSGQKSTFYLDLRKVTLSPSVGLVVDAMADLIDEIPRIPFDAIGGPCVGADPIVGAFLAMHPGSPFRGYLVRKEEKGHGLAGLVIGSVRPGDRCVMVEDVTTTGGSMLAAIRAVEAFGAHVVLAVAVVDRSGGEAGALLGGRGVPFRPLLTLADLGVEEDAS